MRLCPKSLDVKLQKDIEGTSKLFKNGVLQLSELFQQFIKEVGQVVTEIKEAQSQFIAENGVIIEMDCEVCPLPECMEGDGTNKIHRWLLLITTY